MKRGTIINTESGEILGEINEGDKIIRKASIDYLKDTNIWKIEHFYKGHTAEIRQLLLELTPYEKAMLFCLAVYTGYDDCCIKHDNGNPMGTEDIITMSGLARRTAYRVLNSLRKKQIIYKGDDSKEKHYFMNPWLFCKGNRINKVLQTMFRNYRIRVMGGKKWKDIKF